MSKWLLIMMIDIIPVVFGLASCSQQPLIPNEFGTRWETSLEDRPIEVIKYLLRIFLSTEKLNFHSRLLCVQSCRLPGCFWLGNSFDSRCFGRFWANKIYWRLLPVQYVVCCILVQFQGSLIYIGLVGKTKAYRLPSSLRFIA